MAKSNRINTVTINHKKYPIPTLTFEDYAWMEEQCSSIIEAIDGKKYIVMSTQFVCALLKCERNEAFDIVNQHILGGGSIKEIVAAYYEAIGNSDFFSKMMSIGKEAEPKTEAEDPETRKE